MRICEAAQLTAPLKLHDLRHFHASLLVSAGFDLPVIGEMLGHASPRTTARYARIVDEQRKRAAAAVGAAVIPRDSRRRERRA